MHKIPPKFSNLTLKECGLDFFKMAIPKLFFFIFVLSNLQLVDIILAVSGFEPQIFGIGSGRSTNWSTTTAHLSLTQHVSNQQIIQKLTSLESDSDDSDDDSDDVSFFFRFFNAFELFTDSVSSFFENCRKQNMLFFSHLLPHKL